MVANIQTIAFQGVEAVAVEVQVHLAPEQNAFNVVGLPDKSVAESRERMRPEAHVSYHARFQLVAAMNPCRCGHVDDASLACHRLPLCRQEYLAKLSGPLLDRFDIRINVPPVPLSQMIDDEKGESSAAVSARVMAAQAVQLARQDCLNARLDGEALGALAAPDARGRKLLDQIIDDGGLTARGFNRILRVARSLADLAGRDSLTDKDIATALVWRGHS